VLSLCAGAIAADATADIVVVVTSKSMLTSLSANQVSDIFLGRDTRFPDGTPSIPIDQAEGSATRNDFYLKFSGKFPAQVKEHWSKKIFSGRGQRHLSVANGAEFKKFLLENPNGIGYIEQSQVDDSVKVLYVK
jgi:ABC-type phosphate transport system substrate-binding protein